MATGRSNKVVGQTGEYLVAAELGRRGLIATTFTGNVPHYDIIASDENGKHVSVQVKTSRGTSWQFGMQHFCKIEMDGDRQEIGEPWGCPVRRLVVVLVAITDDGYDRFYTMTWKQLQRLLMKHHENYLGRHGGVRPQNPKSQHTALKEKRIGRYRDKWTIVEKNLR